MYSHGHYASKLKALMDSISDWSLASAEQRARAKYFSQMMRLAQRGAGDE